MPQSIRSRSICGEIKDFLKNLTTFFAKPVPPSENEDGHGLHLVKQVDGGGQCVFRYTFLGRRREMGLGGLAGLPYENTPPFYASIQEPTIAHLALRFLILTGLRSRPLRFARMEEIDGDIWTVPSKNMKARVGVAQDFCVPLTGEALRVIDLARPGPDLPRMVALLTFMLRGDPQDRAIDHNRSSRVR